MKMKDKNKLQIEARKKHLNSLGAKRRSEPLYHRNSPNLKEKPTILIVCEGENTEPSYFKRFRLLTADIKTIGLGFNTISLVGRAEKLSNEREYEQVWCVFDKDSNDKVIFNRAVQLAKAKGFNVAYSNQAFEYWIILHFEDHQGGPMNRGDYGKKINKYIKDKGLEFDYKASKIISEDLFEFLESVDPKTRKNRIQLAIQRAKRNHKVVKDLQPADQESVTLVYQLVEILNMYI